MALEASGSTPTAPSSAPPVSYASLPVGSRLGRYQIVQRIARGGMAELYAARAVAHGGFEKLVALKRILPHLGEDSAFVRMFLNEARVAAVLDHSNIAHVIDFGSAGNEHYLVMEYVHGHSVQELLRKTAGKERIPMGVALSIAYELATALHYAHEKTAADGRPLGLVHRDVSPSNVLLSEYGGVKLVDFGIAKATEHTRATESGVIKGKLAYMAPEQVRGESIDRRADVFALGVLTYELTTGRKCFRAAGEFALINRVAQGRYTRPTALDPAFPPDLERILADAMAVDPADRLPSAEAFARAVSRFADEAGLLMSRLGLADYLGSVFESKPPPPTLPVTFPVSTTAGAELPASSTAPIGAPTIARSRRSWLLAGGILAVGLGLGLVAARATSSREDGEPSPAAPPTNALRAAQPTVEPSSDLVTPPVATTPQPPVTVPPVQETPDVSKAQAAGAPETSAPKAKQKRWKPRRDKTVQPTAKGPEYLPPSYR